MKDNIQLVKEKKIEILTWHTACDWPQCIAISFFEVKKKILFQPQTLQLDFLTKILPNYHHLMKPAKVHAAK